MDRAGRIFLLSPASCSGRRAQLLLRGGGAEPLAQALREDGATLADVFAFVSSLYFRGKIAYARAFGRPPAGVPAAWVITSSRGLLDADTRIVLDDLREFAGVPIGVDSTAYRNSLEVTSHALAGRMGARTDIVLLGSIATGKYVEILHDIFRSRLRYPVDFIGRGDMSRGGLMLRMADEGRELDYVPIDDRPRRGARPPKLAPLRRPKRPRRT
jgi:hypothetical protein